MLENNIDKYLQDGIWDINSVNPVTLWNLSEEKWLDNEFFSVCTLCIEGLAELIIKRYNKRTKASDALRLVDVEKLIERCYSDGVLREEDLRRFIKIFAKLATLVQGSNNKNTPLLSKLGHKWFKA